MTTAGRDDSLASLKFVASDSAESTTIASFDVDGGLYRQMLLAADGNRQRLV